MPPQRKSTPRNLELAALAKAIEAQMTKKGIHQKALSERSGVGERRISDYVRGQRSPSLSNLRKLCGALGLTVDALMDRAAKIERELPDG
ncbi:MAG TPA: helix-turn-helix transcriptional regulator [Solirubrobacteraceae bacterium]|nr:helix-turn-helix transcriptional regulator [Solirubrobacteraceae bacterium]